MRNSRDFSFCQFKGLPLFALWFLAVDFHFTISFDNYYFILICWSYLFCLRNHRFLFLQNCHRFLKRWSHLLIKIYFPFVFHFKVFSSVSLIKRQWFIFEALEILKFLYKKISQKHCFNEILLSFLIFNYFFLWLLLDHKLHSHCLTSRKQKKIHFFSMFLNFLLMIYLHSFFFPLIIFHYSNIIEFDRWSWAQS